MQHRVLTLVLNCEVPGRETHTAFLSDSLSIQFYIHAIEKNVFPFYVVN